MAKTVTLFLVWFLDRLSSLENKNIINEGKKKKNVQMKSGISAPSQAIAELLGDAACGAFLCHC